MAILFIGFSIVVIFLPQIIAWRAIQRIAPTEKWRVLRKSFFVASSIGAAGALILLGPVSVAGHGVLFNFAVLGIFIIALGHGLVAVFIAACMHRLTYVALTAFVSASAVVLWAWSKLLEMN